MKNQFKYFFFLLIFIGASCLPHLSEAATLRGVIIGDTNDLLGDLIQRGTSEIEQEMRAIAAYTDMDLEITTIKGNDFNSKKILEKLEKLTVEEDDTVFLFSFSHGYRERETATPWPSIHIKTENWMGEGIDQLLLTKILQEKAPKLLISMFSCCNSYADAPYIPDRIQREAPFSITNTELVKENYRRLFAESSGTIMMSSSTPGKYSLGYDRFGEIFLSAFLDTLRTESQIVALDWETLFSKVHAKTGEISNWIGGNEYQYYPQIEFIDFQESSVTSN